MPIFVMVIDDTREHYDQYPRTVSFDIAWKINHVDPITVLMASSKTSVIDTSVLKRIPQNGRRREVFA